MEKFTIQILLTKGEHVDGAAAALRHGWSVWGAFFLVLCAAVGWFFSLIPNSAVWGAVALGAAAIIFDYFFLPLYTRMNAVGEYERRQELRHTVTATFSNEGVTVDSARVTGTIPYHLCRAVETAQLLVLYVGAEWTLRVPKRLLTDNRLAALRERL